MPADSGIQEFRFGTDDNVPTWAQGKTASEVLNIAKMQEAALRTNQPPPRPEAQGMPPSLQPPGQVDPSSDEWILRPEDATKRVAESVFGDRMAPALATLQGMAAQMAQTQRSLAVQQYADDFRRWGPEIDSVMATVPVETRTLENYEKVVKFVRGSHVEDIATERAKQLIAQGGLGERSGGAGLAGMQSPTGLDFSKLPQGVGEIAKQRGLTEAMVLDYCKATGTTPQQWMEMALNEKVVTSVAPFSFQLNDDKLRIRRGFDS